MDGEMSFPSCLCLAIVHTEMPTVRHLNWGCYFRNHLHQGCSTFNWIMLSYCEEIGDMQSSSRLPRSRHSVWMSVVVGVSGSVNPLIMLSLVSLNTFWQLRLPFPTTLLVMFVPLGAWNPEKGVCLLGSRLMTPQRGERNSRRRWMALFPEESKVK